MSAIDFEVRKKPLIIADFSYYISDELRSALGSTYFELVGDVCSIDELFKKLKIYPDALFICDNKFSSNSGLSHLSLSLLISQLYEDVDLLLFSNMMDAPLIRLIIRSGTVGFITKNNSFNDLYDFCICAAKGELVLDSKIQKLLLKDDLRGSLNDINSWSSDDISSRSKEVFHLLQIGLSPSEIAACYRVSIQAISAIKRRLIKQLGLRSEYEFDVYLREIPFL